MIDALLPVLVSNLLFATCLASIAYAVVGVMVLYFVFRLV